MSHSKNLTHFNSLAALSVLLLCTVASLEATTLPEVVVEADADTDIRTSSESESATKALKADPFGLDQLTQVHGRIPNLSVTDSGLRSYGNIYNIRGVGNTSFFSNPGVVVYVDGIPMGDAYSFSRYFDTVEKMQVLLGPQSSRFGRNAPGGVIDVQTRQPGNKYHVDGSFSYGSFDRQTYTFSLAAPIIKDRLAISVNGYHEKDEGYIYNTTLGRNTDHRDALGGNFSIRFTPSKDWEMVFGMTGDRFDDGSQKLTLLANEDIYQVASDLEGITTIDRNVQYLKLKHTADWGKVLITGSRTDWDLHPSTLDLNLTATPNVGSTIDQAQEQWTQELRVQSHDDVDFKWKAGFFFLTAENTQNSTRTFGFGLPEVTEYNLNEDNFAWFGDLVIPITDQLDLELGTRFDLTEKQLTRSKSNFAGAESPVEGTQEYFNGAANLGLVWQPNENWEFAARTAYTFKPGGFSGFADDQFLAKYDTEKLWTNELSAQWRGFEDKVGLGVTGHWYEIRDYQVERTFNRTNYIIVNAPEAYSKGVEFNALVQPFEGVEARTAFGYNDVRFRNFKDPVTGRNLDDHRAPYIADLTFSQAVTYRHRTGFFGTVEFQAFGDTFYDDGNTQAFKQAGYGLFHATVGYENEHMGVYFTGRNLTGTEYYTNISTDLMAGTPGEPQFFGFTIKGKY